jgi:FKBP-type peptidyl-prolyl cis-trans isomerase SlyD
VVAIDYTIRNQDGEVVDTSSGRRPLIYLHGYRQIVPGVEMAVEGLEAGHAIEVFVNPGDAYGERDPAAILVLPRHAFPDGEDLAAGTMFRAFRPDGKPVIFSVIEASAEEVIVDANHPLAGQTLHVEVEVISVRDATDEELQHGHVHSEVMSPDAV